VTYRILILFVLAAALSAATCGKDEPRSSGGIIYRALPTPCGVIHESEINESNTAPNYTFTGHEIDNVLGMQDFGARMYNPTLCQFTSVDPVDNPTGSNFRYARNNPINYVDPDGRQEKPSQEGAITKIKETIALLAPIKQTNPPLYSAAIEQIYLRAALDVITAKLQMEVPFAGAIAIGERVERLREQGIEFVVKPNSLDKVLVGFTGAVLFVPKDPLVVMSTSGQTRQFTSQDTLILYDQGLLAPDGTQFDFQTKGYYLERLIAHEEEHLAAYRGQRLYRPQPPNVSLKEAALKTALVYAKYLTSLDETYAEDYALHALEPGLRLVSESKITTADQRVGLRRKVADELRTRVDAPPKQ